MEDQNKRPTVNVTCSVPTGVQLRRHSPAAHEHAPQLPTGEGYVLKQGSNPGVDKEWFDGWMKENENSSLVQSGVITAIDEKDDQNEDDHHD